MRPALAEPLRDVVVAAGVFGVTVRKDHHADRIGRWVDSPVDALLPSGVHTSYTMRTPPTPSKLRSVRVVAIRGDYRAGRRAIAAVCHPRCVSSSG